MNAQGWRIVRCIAAPVVSVLVLCQCETQRTYGAIRKSTVTIDNNAWGGQAGGEESSTDKKDNYSIADNGWDIAEDGTRTAKRDNLYAGQKARGFDNKVGMKEARLGKSEARVKEFKTPEYLKMQEFNGVSEAKLGNTNARENNAEKNQSNFASMFFKKPESKSSNTFATYKTNDFSDGTKTFATDGNRAGMNAIKNSPRADGVAQMTGYKEDSSMSMDDVKKLLNPNAYARGTGIHD